jgi:uncharacterized protein (DUF1501 family)
MNVNRRRFFYTTAWGGVIGMAWPKLYAAESMQDGGPALVVIQLAGGNDGLNTVVPIDNDHYYKARPQLAIKPRAALSINDSTGLHPSLAGLAEVYNTGRLAIVEGVGYPHPNRSHFRSTEIWHTASDAGKTERYGWLGRYFDTYCRHDAASIGVCIGKQNPQAFAAAMPKGVTFSDPRRMRVRQKDLSDEMMQMMGMEEDLGDDDRAGGSIAELSGGGPSGDPAIHPLDFLKNTASEAKSSSQQVESILKQTQPQTTFPDTRFAKELQVVSQLIRGGMPTRIYYLSHGGFDTHSSQLAAHAGRLKEWSDGMQAFMKEMEATRQAGRVCVMVFSEFGRRVAENASGGTDHGVAAPCFVMGGGVRGGMHGRRPSLAPGDLEKGDIVHTVDYRAVYATLLEKHLGVDSKPVLLKPFDPMGFLG